MLAFVRKNSIAVTAAAITVLVIAYGAADAKPGGNGRRVAATASKTKQLPKNSVGARQLKKDAVNGSKVKDNSLTGAEIKVSTLGTVPDATHATSADSASHAGNSDLLGGLPASAFQLRVTSRARPGSAPRARRPGPSSPGSPAPPSPTTFRS